MISQTAEYALRAIVWLAGQNDASGTAIVAESTRVPPGYMSKVLQTLARAGLVASHPGRNGGFELKRPPEKIAVLDVINAVDPIQRIRRCPLDIKSHGANLCPLHRKLDDAMAAAESAFASTTIADLLKDAGGSVPLCDEARPKSGAVRITVGGKQEQ